MRNIIELLFYHSVERIQPTNQRMPTTPMNMNELLDQLHLLTPIFYQKILAIRSLNLLRIQRPFFLYIEFDTRFK